MLSILEVGKHSLAIKFCQFNPKTQALMLLLKLFLKLRPIIVIFLFVAFLLVFGLPSYTKLIRQDIFIKETKLSSGPIDSPAITICVDPVSSDILVCFCWVYFFTFQGPSLRVTEEDTRLWRGSWTKWMEEVLCNTTIASVDDFYKCVDSLVYKREELIFRMQDFSFDTTNLRNRDEN